MGQYEPALEDADASIDKDKTFFEVKSSFHDALFLNLHVWCKCPKRETLQHLCMLMFCRACTKKQKFYTWWENSSLHWCFIIEDTGFVLTHRCSGWVSRKQRRLLKTLLAVSNSTCLFIYLFLKKKKKQHFFFSILSQRFIQLFFNFKILSFALFRSWRCEDWDKGRFVAFTTRWGECLWHLSSLDHFCGSLKILILVLWIILTSFPNEYPGKRKQPIAAVEYLMQEKKQKIQKTPKNEKTTRKLLREFYTDMKYLESLLKDKSTAILFTISLFLYHNFF